MNEESQQLLRDIKKAFEGHTDNVVETIKATVNGKIDRLSQSVNAWQKEEAEKRVEIDKKLDDYIEKTNLYMESTKPMVEFFEDVTSTKKVLFYLLGGLGTIGGFWLLIREIFK